jgi:hypothetical protein
MVTRLEVELARRADLAQDLGVLLRVAVRRRRVGQVRERCKQPVDLGFDRPQVLLEAFDLLAQRPRLGRIASASFSPATQLLDLREKRSPPLVELEQLVDSPGRPSPGERRLDAAGVAADQLEVERRGS